MTHLARWCASLGVLGFCAAPAQAQLGELQFGPTVSYGSGSSYGSGAGAAFGVSVGRLAYVGLRWTAYRGATVEETGGPSTAMVRNRTQVTALDLGVVIPAGMFEFVPGFSIGAVWFRQRATHLTAGGSPLVTSAHAEEFFVAPGLAVEIHAGGLVLIPQLQYCLAGRPDLPWPAHHGGALASVRLVVPIELHRIRR